jgi:hypothetical protein
MLTFCRFFYRGLAKQYTGYCVESTLMDQPNGQAPAYIETAYDWEEERRKKKDFSDDGTTSYFWLTIDFVNN